MTGKKDDPGQAFPKSGTALAEEKVLEFWEQAKTFERSVLKEAPQGDYVFYDGPPFGTGEPHYGHILSSVAKDAVPRYWTMKGYRVERRWGWDCHGLPIENIIEKDLGISGKKEIEAMGVAKFNEACRARVLEYADIWDVMVRRIARWVDFRNSYKTMDPDFMESVWWGFKEMWAKGLVYEGRRVLLYCPRCETPISNFEVAMDNSYKEIREPSLYVKFEVDNKKTENRKQKTGIDLPNNTFIIAWTTTPWTLPGNVALAVGPEIKYALVRSGEAHYILAKERLAEVFQGIQHEVVSDLKAEDLEGLRYEPLYEVPALHATGKRAHYVAAGEFVTTEDGSGVVHTAVVYGEDDYNLGLKLDLPVVPLVDEKGHFNQEAPEFIRGAYFKKADKAVIEDLGKRGLVFKKTDHSHSYPHCHRCETQLFYNAIPAWFIAINKIRQRMLELNERINWFPAHLKEGRFRLGLEQAPDWNISRNRYFATPIPIWVCRECSEKEVVGSIRELEEKSGRTGIKDIHSHFIDGLSWACPKCGKGEMFRVKEVFDCWVESGSMSFAQHHYPFENKEKFERNFPAQYISEYISQTRAWFYVMHAVSTAVFDSNSFENVVTTGVILNESGQKMSKSKKNYPDPWKVINSAGVDALRFYLMGSSIMRAENLFFSERELTDVLRKNVMLLQNVLRFFSMFAPAGGIGAGSPEPDAANALDRWVLSRLHQLTAEMTLALDGYDLPRACRPVTAFIDDLSNWYLRRSRDRFKGDDADDREAAIAVTAYTLRRLSKLIAPLMPFIAEQVWQAVTGFAFAEPERSVHLEAWPEAGAIDQKVLEEMAATRRVVELALAKRDEAGIKVRQPLRRLVVHSPRTVAIKNQYIALIRDEVNVREVEFAGSAKEIAVELDTAITPELAQEGLKRELVRAVNARRKELGFTLNDRIALLWQSEDQAVKDLMEAQAEVIKRDVLADRIEKSTAEGMKEVKLNESKAIIGISKV